MFSHHSIYRPSIFLGFAFIIAFLVINSTILLQSSNRVTQCQLAVAKIQSQDLIRAIQNVIGQSDTKSEATVAGLSPMNLIDRDAVLAGVDGDEALLQEIVSMFLEYSPQRRNEIRSAVKTGDFAGLRRTTHALKGTIGYLDAGPVSDAIQQLDQLAVSADAQRLPEALADFERQLDELTIAAAALVATDGFSRSFLTVRA